MITTKVQKVIDALAQELRLPKEAILEQGMKTFSRKEITGDKSGNNSDHREIWDFLC